MPWFQDLSGLAIALALVFLNGFFVAAEFAFVKVRGSQLDGLIKAKRPFAKTAKWLYDRMDASLSACQLGITMASLALGWVGEPAFAHLIEPALNVVGIESEYVLHLISFIVAFSIITALHLVVGEQAPKIFAIRRPDQMVLWCALPMKFFYIILWPFLTVLNIATTWLLKRFGLEGDSSHDTPHSEEELRALLRQSHLSGDVTRAEHRLINAVFEFDDMICRRVMVPRGEVELVNINNDFKDIMQQIQKTKHTRYPVCDGSLDTLLGVIHTKDLLAIDPDSDFDIKTIMRVPERVPESMPISKVLRHFQKTHQLMAFVIDEYGTTIGIVTLENVLERIVGPVDDEFDIEEIEINEISPGVFEVAGGTHITEVEKVLQLNLDDNDVDTIAGVVMSRSGQLPTVGDTLDFGNALAEILEVKNNRASLIRIVKTESVDVVNQ